MASKIRFSDKAVLDIELMMDHYRAVNSFLAQAFRRDLYEKLDDLLFFPESGAEFRSRIRRLLLIRFSCWIYYSIEPEEVAVVAVFHCSRDITIVEERLTDNA